MQKQDPRIDLEKLFPHAIPGARVPFLRPTADKEFSKTKTDNTDAACFRLLFLELDEELKEVILAKYGKLDKRKPCTVENINEYISEFYKHNQNFIEIEETLEDQDNMGI